MKRRSLIRKILDWLTPVRSWERRDPRDPQAAYQRRKYQRDRQRKIAYATAWTKQHRERHNLLQRRRIDRDPERWRAICRENMRRYYARKKAEREALAA